LIVDDVVDDDADDDIDDDIDDVDDDDSCNNLFCRAMISMTASLAAINARRYMCSGTWLDADSTLW